jgi:hypothetical protein
MSLLNSILRRVRQRAFVILDPQEILRVDKAAANLASEITETLLGSSAFKEYIIILVRNDHETRPGEFAALF